jgi:hypothetical protein
MSVETTAQAILQIYQKKQEWVQDCNTHLSGLLKDLQQGASASCSGVLQEREQMFAALQQLDETLAMLREQLLKESGIAEYSLVHLKTCLSDATYSRFCETVASLRAALMEQQTLEQNLHALLRQQQATIRAAMTQIQQSQKARLGYQKLPDLDGYFFDERK